MPELTNAQHLFGAALADAAAGDEATALFAGDPAQVRNRLAIYRGNVVANADGALAATYPIVRKLVGADFFGGLARAYNRQHPSVSGDLNELGEHFAQFISGFPHAQALPYLPDVARMEWLVQRAHYAADHAPLDISRLAGISENDYARLIVRLHPAVSLLASNYPLFRIWEVHQDDYGGEIAVDLAAGAAQIVVYRPQFRVSVAPLSAGEAVFLDAILRGTLLGDALEQAVAQDAGFDLPASLQRWAASNIVVGVSVGKTQALE